VFTMPESTLPARAAYGMYGAGIRGTSARCGSAVALTGY